MRSRFSIHLICCVASLCGLPACAQQTSPPPFELTIEGDTVTYRGPLRGAGAGELARVLGDDSRTFHRLVITSPGGEGPDGLRIGQLVHDRRMDIRVERYCISACANFVFVAARRKTIAPQSIVAFHISPALAATLFRGSGDRKLPEPFRGTAETVARFYRSIGVDIALLDVSTRLMRPICVGEVPSRPVADPRRYFVAWGRTGFIPSRDQLMLFGVRDVDGWWPSRAELPATLRNLGFRSNYQPLYEPDGGLVRSAMDAQQAPVPDCPPSIGPGDGS